LQVACETGLSLNYLILSTLELQKFFVLSYIFDWNWVSSWWQWSLH